VELGLLGERSNALCPGASGGGEITAKKALRADASGVNVGN